MTGRTPTRVQYLHWDEVCGYLPEMAHAVPNVFDMTPAAYKAVRSRFADAADALPFTAGPNVLAIGDSLLDRRRLELLLGVESAEVVVDALRPYQNPDGGFGHALEPGMGAPASEPGSTLLALETPVEVGVTRHPVIEAAADWLAAANGTLPQVTAMSSGYPHAPFINPGGSTFLTFALAGALWRTDVRTTWLDRATAWCWQELGAAERLHTYTVGVRAQVPRRRTRHRSRTRCHRAAPPAPGRGREHARPGRDHWGSGHAARPVPAAQRSQSPTIHASTDHGGGWDFGFLHWSGGQSLDWRGSVTVSNLRHLQQNRINLPPAA